MSNFSNLNLNPKILSALESKGYTTPTPIQLQAIPHLIEGKDILGIAQTGTGKTAAFSLPIIHNLAKTSTSVKSGGVRALILTPTRELASQISDNIEAYGKDLSLRHAVIFGGVSERPQISKLQRGTDILIATPGRLLDLATQGYIRFMQLEIFVLDEADRMLDMGFINDIKKIIARIPKSRQTLFFSATMPKTIFDLANSILKEPIKIEITPQSTTVERIAQKINFVEKSNKSALLKRIIKEEGAKSVLVFCRTKHGSDRVEEFLEKNSIKVAAIHGNKSQGAREKALDKFREGDVQVLIATDIAARGIDVPDITHVINYDIPMDPESYVHRIGRTARAGKEGIAISFCDPSELKLLQAVEKTINYKIPVDETHPFHNVASTPSKNYSGDGDRKFNSNPNRRNISKHRDHNLSTPKSRSHSSDDNNSYRSSKPRGNYRKGEESNSFDRDNRRNDRRNVDKRNERRTTENSYSPDGKKTSLLDFIGFGKKRSDQVKSNRNYSDRSERPRNKNSSRTSGKDFFRVDEKESNKFSFNWFRSKKPDMLNTSESSDRNNRSNQFENRNRQNSRSDSRRDGNNRANFNSNNRSSSSSSSNKDYDSRPKSNSKTGNGKNGRKFRKSW